MAINIKRLELADVEFFKKLLRVFEEAFKMKDYQMPDESYLKKLLERDGFLVLVALKDDIVVGGLTGYTIQSYYNTSSEMYIYDLAIKSDLQRQGIGTKLLQALKEYCSEKGYKEIFVQANEPDTHALEFYRSTGGRSEKVVHFSYLLNDKSY